MIHKLDNLLKKDDTSYTIMDKIETNTVENYPIKLGNDNIQLENMTSEISIFGLIIR